MSPGSFGFQTYGSIQLLKRSLKELEKNRDQKLSKRRGIQKSKIEDQKRVKCYETRDLFYKCKSSSDESEGIINSTKSVVRTSAEPCSSLLEEYKANCPKSWIKYWDERVKRGQPLRTPGGHRSEE
jgi:hypothetical protein